MVKFVNTIANPQIFTYRGYKIQYTVEKGHLVVVGSMFLLNWSSKFRVTLNELEKALNVRCT